MRTHPSASRLRAWSSLSSLALAVIVLFALACAPARSYRPEPAPGYGGDYEGGDYGGGYAESEREYEAGADSSAFVGVEERAEIRAAPAPSRDGGRFKAKKLDKAAQMPAASQAQGATAVAEPSTATPVPAPEPVPEDAAPASAAARRQIIYTAGLGLRVFEIDETMAKLEAIPDRHGGWIQQRDDERIVLRVPAAKLDAILAEIGEWGVVVHKTLEALDVTAQYTDLDSRIRVLEQMEAQLQALLERAQDVEQALAIQMELSRIRAELEGLRAQMRLLASAIEFSTLAVQLYRQGIEAPAVGNDPFTWVDSLGVEATAYR